MNRRGFVRGLLGLLGLGAVAKTTVAEPKAKEMGYYSSNRLQEMVQDKTLRAQCHERIEKALDRHVSNWRQMSTPNPDEDWGGLFIQLIDQMLLTGVGLAWMVPNKLGEVYEIYTIPTATAIPHPAAPGYPDGYYTIQPIYPLYQPSRFVTSSDQNGLPIIPAQRMLRVTPPSPLTELRVHIDSASEIDRLRKEFEAMYTGLGIRGHKGRLFVLPPGSQIRSL